MTTVTICFPTMRKHPKLMWLLDSLDYQRKKYPDLQIQFIVIDYWQNVRNGHPDYEQFVFPPDLDVLHISPLPSNVQGRYRSTVEVWYAAANARNSGFVYAKHDHIAFADDLAVLGQRWLEGIIEAVEGNYIALGAYQKHINMVVENGKIISSDLALNGMDVRWEGAADNSKARTRGGNLYGCSYCMPLEAGLKINGFDCLTDTIGYEDCVAGIRIESAKGYEFYYDKRMLSIESNDYPSKDFTVKREDIDLGIEKYNEVLHKLGIEKSMYPDTIRHDTSHIIIEVSVQCSPKAVWNFFDLRELREKVKRGEEITIKDMKYPEKNWFD